MQLNTAKSIKRDHPSILVWLNKAICNYFSANTVKDRPEATEKYHNSAETLNSSSQQALLREANSILSVQNI